MKILSVHNRYQQVGGEDGSTAQERALLRAHGHEVLEYEEHNDRIEGMSKLHVALRTIWSVETYKNIRKLIQKERPDTVHVQNFFPLISPSVFWACHRERVPAVLHLRNFRLLCPSAYLYFDGRVYEDNVGKLFPWKAVKDAVYRDSHLATLTIALMLFVHRLLGTWTKKITAYIALTEFQKKKMIEGGLPADKIFVKPNFIQRSNVGDQKSEDRSQRTEVKGQGSGIGDQIAEPAEQQPEEEPLSADVRSLISGRTPFALFVGRLSPEKGCDVLIRAWREFSDKWRVTGVESSSSTNNDQLTTDNNQPQLIIVGDGPDEARLKSLADGMDSIKFLGQKKGADVLALAQGALTLVFPSVWYEGMPRTIIEAFSVSTSVIASGLGSMREMIMHQKTGLLFESGNSDDLSAKLVWAFDHTAEMEKMGVQAYRDFELKYSDEANYQQLMAIYQHARKW